MNLYHWNLEKEKDYKLMHKIVFIAKLVILRIQAKISTGLYQKVGEVQLTTECKN